VDTTSGSQVVVVPEIGVGVLKVVVLRVVVVVM
jgi:hypothetical protein